MQFSENTPIYAWHSGYGRAAADAVDGRALNGTVRFWLDQHRHPRSIEGSERWRGAATSIQPEQGDDEVVQLHRRRSSAVSL